MLNKIAEIPAKLKIIECIGAVLKVLIRVIKPKALVGVNRTIYNKHRNNTWLSLMELLPGRFVNWLII